ncbi:MAG: phenylacetate-CoA oxygenase/reductase subunit PaaK [Proteobacteria bacterium]|nr:phenylacetate-CoA oxygenase/reductase subunit PaaK [Pseudomonadota bacterium]
MSRFHPLKIEEIRRETRDSVSLRLAVPDALKPQFAFRPGQYLTLRATIDGEDIRRSYSICSGVDDGVLRVGIKKVEGGAFSTYANENLKPGDVIEVMPPEGRFTPSEGQGRHLLGIAAGSGITPILSIAKSALARDAAARVTLIFGNRTSLSVMFAEEIEDLKNVYLGRFSVVHLLSREAQDIELLQGRVTGDKIRVLASGVIDFADIDEAFLCGPEAMVAEMKAVLPELGIPAEKIRSELFTPSEKRKSFKPKADVAGEARVVADVTAVLDGKAHRFDLLSSDENIIDAAARAGIDLPYSCKGGMCCTCRCKVEEGEAEMAINYSLEPWELEANFVLGCQSLPKTPVLKVNFDHM